MSGLSWDEQTSLRSIPCRDIGHNRPVAKASSIGMRQLNGAPSQTKPHVDPWQALETHGGKI